MTVEEAAFPDGIICRKWADLTAVPSAPPHEGWIEIYIATFFGRHFCKILLTLSCDRQSAGSISVSAVKTGKTRQLWEFLPGCTTARLPENYTKDRKEKITEASEETVQAGKTDAPEETEAEEETDELPPFRIARKHDKIERKPLPSNIYGISFPINLNKVDEETAAAGFDHHWTYYAEHDTKGSAEKDTLEDVIAAKDNARVLWLDDADDSGMLKFSLSDDDTDFKSLSEAVKNNDFLLYGGDDLFEIVELDDSEIYGSDLERLEAFNEKYGTPDYLIPVAVPSKEECEDPDNIAILNYILVYEFDGFSMALNIYESYDHDFADMAADSACYVPDTYTGGDAYHWFSEYSRLSGNHPVPLQIEQKIRKRAFLKGSLLYTEKPRPRSGCQEKQKTIKMKKCIR